jgi:hypothetical protein
MFEQPSRLAEKLAASVSRRGFLGSLGGWAAAAAMGVAGMLTTAGTARAHHETYCNYGACGFFIVNKPCKNNPCPPSYRGCPLQGCINYG